MTLEGNHRRLVKHLDEPGEGHELTFSCYRRLPLLADDGRCSHLAIAVDRAIQRHSFLLLAYVFMPEHVHLIVMHDHGGGRICDLLYAIKRPVSYRIKQELIIANDPLLEKLTIRERPGKTAFRLWQEGSGYDRNIVDTGLLRRMIDYVHLNPIRRGLVHHPGDWRWSSWSCYEGEQGRTCGKLPRVHPMT